VSNALDRSQMLYTGIVSNALDRSQDIHNKNAAFLFS